LTLLKWNVTSLQAMRLAAGKRETKLKPGMRQDLDQLFAALSVIASPDPGDTAVLSA